VGANGLIKASAGPDAVSKVPLYSYAQCTRFYRAYCFSICYSPQIAGYSELRASTALSYKKLSYRRETVRCFVSFAKSLNVIEVIRNDTLEWDVCKSLLMFHCMYVSRTVSEIFSVE